MKESYTAEALCTGLPGNYFNLIIFIDEFAKYLSYVKKLHFEEKPDYYFLKQLFIDLLTKQELVFDNIFDWMLPVH